MFGLFKKKKNRQYKFGDIDREVAETIRHRKAMRKLEKLKALESEHEQRKTGSLAEQLQELRETAEQLGYVKADDAGNSSDAELIGLLLQVLQGQKQAPIPQDIENAVTKKKGKQKPINNDVSGQIADKVPLPIKMGIKSGAITKKMAKEWADKQFEETWKTLKGSKSK
jgi:hypothetical protein